MTTASITTASRPLGRPKVFPPDVRRRRRLYERLRDQLNMSAAELADLTCLSVQTIQHYPGYNRATAPTYPTLNAMRNEVLRRAEIELKSAQERLMRAEIEAATAAEDCLMHIRDYVIEIDEADA